MAIVSSPVLNALRTGFRADFQKTLESVEPQFEKVASVIPSTTKSNTYGWLGAMPSFREWVGARQFQSLKESSYAIVNKTFESSVEVSRDDIEDDNLGIYKPAVQEMAREGGSFPDELVFGLLKDGFTTPCFDGQNFFDADHPVNANHDGSGADASASNVKVNVEYTGEPWYLLDTSRSLKPLIWQNRRALDLTTKFNPNDESVFTNNTFQFGADLRGNAGFGFWQMAFGVKDELNADNFWHAWEAMRQFKRDGGKGLKIKPTMLVVPASLERKATELLERQYRAVDGTTVDNELAGKVELLVVNAL